MSEETQMHTTPHQEPRPPDPSPPAPPSSPAVSADHAATENVSASWAPLRPAILFRLKLASTALRTLGLNVLLIVTFILLLPLIVGQFWRSDVMIQPISVPDSLAATGLKPDVAANRLWDALQDFARSARTSKTSIVAIPDSQRVQFSFPDSGISIDSLVINLRRFFKLYDTRIGGEFLCADAACAPEGRHLRIRVMTRQSDVIDLPPIGKTSERDYFREAAAGIYGVLDPFVAIAAQADSEPLRATVLARRLIRSHHPDAKWALNLIGNIRLSANDPAGALEEYRAALALDPSFQIARSNLGRALRLTGDLAGAKAAFTELQRSNAASPLSAEGFAEVALAAGDRTEALRQLEIAAARDPLNSRLLTKAGTIEMDAKHEVAAAKYFARALEIDPGSPAAFSGLATIHLAKGDYVAAERLYRDAADYTPDNAETQFDDARLLLLMKSYTSALARIDRATRLAPTNVTYRLLRAKALQPLGRHAEALDELEAAKTLEPQNAEIFSAMGDSFRDTGRKSEAVAAYQRFLQLDPKSIMAPVITAIVSNLKK
jgi:tetratricopeptide (TPR) repeat protein